jgi:two-component system aerobic respiration control sensor histidine kinase ArcB
MPQSKIRILLVEDNKFAQMAAKGNLETIGCLIDVASSGAEGIRKGTDTQYDIIFMDIGLEDGMDGFIVSKKIKESQLNAKTPIVVLTAHSEESYRKYAFDIGIDDFLVKPLTVEDAKTIIAKFFPEEGNHLTEESLEA